MDNKKQQKPIIIKKVNKSAEHGSHGAWKVAYADFVTAMMTFFLLMWLLNATTEDQRKGIAEYFDPRTPISRISGGGVGMFGGDSIFSQDKLAKNGVGGNTKRDDKFDNNKTIENNNANENNKEILNKEMAESQYANMVNPFLLIDEQTLNEQISKDTQEKNLSEAELKDLQNKELMRKRVVLIQDLVKSKIQNEEQLDDIKKHLYISSKDDGIHLEIVDQDKESLFEISQSKPTKKMLNILQVLTQVLSDVDAGIMISGHTDSLQYSGKSYSNWELSSERALSARRLILNNNPQIEKKILSVQGKSDLEPFIAENPLDPRNRRISITFVPKKAN